MRLSRLAYSLLALAAAGSTLAAAKIHAANFTQPLDHFANTTKLTFQQRYWYSLDDYVPPSKRSARGGPAPIFLFDAGEFNAEERLAVLDTHIIHNFTKSFGGVGVVLENRYYGKSYPKLSAFEGSPKTWGVDELRWLTHNQSLEDTARFIRAGMHFQGVNKSDVAKSPVIMYGGSLAGARAAHLRVRYPKLYVQRYDGCQVGADANVTLDSVFGAWSSSAPMIAVPSLYAYYWPIARSENATAMQAIKAAWASIDRIIAPDPASGSVQPKRDHKKLSAFLTLAGVPNLTEPADWASLARNPLDGHDTAIWFTDNTTLPSFLDSMVHTEDSLLAPLQEQAAQLGLLKDLNHEAMRLINFLRKNGVDGCTGPGGDTADKCFGRKTQEVYLLPDPVLSELKSFVFQACTEYGWWRTAPPVSKTNASKHAGPKILSSLVDLRYSRYECDDPAFFPKGKHFKMPRMPNTGPYNAFGNITIRMPRLGFVDGQEDPWRSVSVHSEWLADGGTRSNTLDEPFILIPGAVHHWEMFNTPQDSKHSKPAAVEAVQKQMLEATAHWLQQWKGPHEERGAA